MTPRGRGPAAPLPRSARGRTNGGPARPRRARRSRPPEVPLPPSRRHSGPGRAARRSRSDGCWHRWRRPRRICRPGPGRPDRSRSRSPRLSCRPAPDQRGTRRAPADSPGGIARSPLRDPRNGPRRKSRRNVTRSSPSALPGLPLARTLKVCHRRILRSPTASRAGWVRRNIDCKRKFAETGNANISRSAKQRPRPRPLRRLWTASICASSWASNCAAFGRKKGSP